MSTTFDNVADAAAELAGDPKVKTRVRGEIHRNQLVTLLIQMRVEQGLTQEKVAESMGCNASKVSRLESGNDHQLKWVDILGYVEAVGAQMSICFDNESLSHAARIKQCVFKIGEDLNRLSALASECKDDEKMVEGINRFYREVLFNFLARYREGADKLAAFTVPPKPREIALQAKKATEKEPALATC